jgi:hypothetical protein
LEKHLLPADCYEQDGAPSHTAFKNLFLRQKSARFYSNAEWLSSSTDLNLLDFSIWGYMLAQLKNYKYQNLLDYKKVVTSIRAAIPDFGWWSKIKGNPKIFVCHPVGFFEFMFKES